MIFGSRHAKTLYCPTKLKKNNLLRVSSSSIGTVRCFCFCVRKRLGQYSTSGLPDKKTLYCPNVFGPGMQKCCTVPIFDPETLKRFFLSFLGQYSVFAPLSLKDRDSTALQALQVSKTLYCPNVFGSRRAKTLYCPNVFWVQACKNAVLSQSLSWRPSKDWFFERFGTERCFCFTVPKRLGQYSTSGLPGVPMGLL